MESPPRLLIPGPVDLDERVLAALSEPVIPHYGDEWVPLYRRLQEGVRSHAGTAGSVYLLAASGSGALEAGVRSLTSPGDRVLVPVSGYFSQRFYDVALANDLETYKLDVEPGLAPTPEQIAEAIDSLAVKTLLLCHNETSCGAICDAEAIGRVCRDRGVNVLLDAISSLASVEIRADDWGLDYVAAASQKGLEGPPGLAPAIITPRGWETYDRNPGRPAGWYFDFGVWRGFERDLGEYHPQPATMPVNVARALDVAIRLQDGESREERYRRIAAGAAGLREALRELGFRVLAPESVASPTVTCAFVPPDLEGRVGDLLAWMRDECGFILAEGFGPLQGRIIRIGHMSRRVFESYLPEFLSGLERYLRLARAA